MAGPPVITYAPAALAAASGIGALIVSRRKSTADADQTMVGTAKEVVKMVKDSMADELARVNTHLARCEAENTELRARVDQLEAALR